ncbi:MAG: methyltransferase domain-containing protein [Acidimicrobiales bacterium]
MHVQAYDFVARHAAGTAGARVLEIGSLDINGSVRPLFATAASYHGLDLVAGPGVDEVADAADWRSAPRFDVVVSTEVLEHAPRWRDILTNAWEALVPGGRLIVTCATDPRPPHSAVDGWALRDGEWYGNVPVSGVLELVRRWGATRWSLEVALDRGDLYLRADKP